MTFFQSHSAQKIWPHPEHESSLSGRRNASNGALADWQAQHVEYCFSVGLFFLDLWSQSSNSFLLELLEGVELFMIVGFWGWNLCCAVRLSFALMSDEECIELPGDDFELYINPDG